MSARGSTRKCISSAHRRARVPSETRRRGSFSRGRSLCCSLCPARALSLERACRPMARQRATTTRARHRQAWRARAPSSSERVFRGTSCSFTPNNSFRSAPRCGERRLSAQAHLDEHRRRHLHLVRHGGWTLLALGVRPPCREGSWAGAGEEGECWLLWGQRAPVRARGARAGGV